MIDKFVCDKCGDIDHVLVDGYLFGERLLEGVYFKVTINGEEFKVVLDEGQDDYCKQLNMKYWLEEAHEFVNQYDFGECPNCHEDVHLGEPYNPETTPPRVGVPAKAFALGELLTKTKKEIDEGKKNDEKTGSNTK